jgi:proline iminopeptidase
LKAVLKRLSGGISVLAALLLAPAVGTRDGDSVAALVTGDAGLPSREVAGVALHLRIVEGPSHASTIVVLHGRPGGDVRSLMGLSALSDAHRVVVYGQRGAGSSERVGPERLTLDAYLDEVDAVIALTSPARPVVLIGHSWGAMLTSAYLGAPGADRPGHPGRARLSRQGRQCGVGSTIGAVHVGRGLCVAGRAARLSRGAGGGTGRACIRLPDWADGRRHREPSPHPRNPDHCGAGYTAPSRRFGASASALWRQAPDADADRFARGTEFPGSALFLAGGCNDWTGASLQARHAARFPDADLRVIPEAGHDVVCDAPAATLDAIRRFLADEDEQSSDVR